MISSLFGINFSPAFLPIVIISIVTLTFFIFIVYTFFKKSGIFHNALATFDENSKIKAKLGKNYEKQVASLNHRRENLEKNYKIQQTQLYLVSFLREAGIRIEPELLDKILNEILNDEFDFLIFSKKLSENIDFPENILNLLYSDFQGANSQKWWEKVKDSSDLPVLFDLLENNKKICYDNSQIPKNVIFQILQRLRTYSISEFNQIINDIVRCSKEIKIFETFLKEEGIEIQNRIQLWVELLQNSVKYINPPLQFPKLFFNICKEVLIFTDNHKSISGLSEIILFYFSQRFFPEYQDVLLKEIGDSEGFSKSFWLFCHKKPSSMRLGEFLKNEWQNFSEPKMDLIQNKLFQKYREKLIEGNLVNDSGKLFLLYINDMAYDLQHLNALLFNPLIPIDFNYALNQFYSLEISTQTVLSSFGVIGDKKPFILTFSAKQQSGGIRKYLEDILKTKHYLMEQYSNNARIGIISPSEDFSSIEDLAEDLQDSLREKFQKEIESINEITALLAKYILKLKMPNSSIILDKLNQDLVKYFNSDLTKEEIIAKIDEIPPTLEIEDSEVNSEIEDLYNKLTEKIELFPPRYQILLHELQDDPEKIVDFGTYKRNDPLQQIKQLWVQNVSDKGKIISVLVFDLKKNTTKYQSMKIWLENLINKMTIFNLVSKKLPDELKKDAEMFLDKKTTALIRTKIAQNSQNLLELSFFLVEKMQLPNTMEKLDLEEFPQKIEPIITTNIEFIDIVKKSLQEILLLPKYKKFRERFDENILTAISVQLITSLLCLALVIYHDVLDDFDIILEKQIRKIEQSILSKIGEEIFKDAQFKRLLETLLSFYSAHQIEPLFASGTEINEEMFHKECFRHLHRYFGEDVQDQKKLGGGPVDFLVFNYPVDVKVEDKVQDILKIYNNHKDQIYKYCYDRKSPIGFLYVYDNTEKGPGFNTQDFEIINEKSFKIIIILLRGNFPFASYLKRKKSK